MNNLRPVIRRFPLAALLLIGCISGGRAVAQATAPKPEASLSALTSLNTFNPDAKAFCRDIKAIYDETPNGLANLLGAERTQGPGKTGTGRFNVKVAPAGMEGCYISSYRDGRKYLSCTALSDSPKSAAAAAAAKLVELMQTCRPGLVVRAHIDDAGDASIDMRDPTSPAVQSRAWTLHVDDEHWDVMLNIRPTG